MKNAPNALVLVSIAISIGFTLCLHSRIQSCTQSVLVVDDDNDDIILLQIAETVFSVLLLLQLLYRCAPRRNYYYLSKFEERNVN